MLRVGFVGMQPREFPLYANSSSGWPNSAIKAMCATRHLRRTASRGTRKQHFAERLNLPAPSLSGPVTSGEGRLQVHFAQWGESVGGTKSHPTRARGSDQETALAEPR